VTRFHRNVNIGAVIIPFVAVLASIPMLWNKWIGWSDVALFAVMYFVSTMGITVGFHRLLTHRAFQTYKPIEYLFAAAGSMAVEGPVIGWVSDHRRHHAFADVDGDPHSPHGHGDGFGGTLRGLWHAHLGWLFDHPTAKDADKHAPDLLEDRGMRVVHRSFGPLVLLGLAIPFFAGWGLHGEVVGGLTALFWAGLVRIFLVHHVTFSINSICHFFGQRRFSTEDHSTNVFWLALPSFGESWHHNHHAFPRSALHGLRWYELDPGGWLIRAMKRAGLAWNVVLITKERQQQRLSEAAEAAKAAAEAAAPRPRAEASA
jgi:stearoyl-CoA desaturase (delta-9 desaturase)